MKRRDFLKTAVCGIGVPFIPDLKGQGTILGVKSDSMPPQTEAGVGALIAWADRLWAVTYISSVGIGTGTGLYEIDENLSIQKRHESNGVYANRMLHIPSGQVSIGPYMIDAEGSVRIIEQLVNHRLTATMTHLYDQENKVYILTMEGLLFEVDVHTLKATKLYDLVKEFSIIGQPHFKGGFTRNKRVIVANNSYNKPGDTDGKLAEWDGSKWSIIENKPFMDVSSCWNYFGGVVFANGWDDSSAILKVCSEGIWRTYRLPKASHAFDHCWTTEWTRIREVETERYLMDCHGMFYELSPLNYGDTVYGVFPVCKHLRMVPDFCSFQGYFVMAGNEATPTGGNILSPQAQSGIWFGKTDDLWQFGKPQGWGGPWRNTSVKAGVPSDPFLMTGFDKKVLHLWQKGAGICDITVEVDFLGNGSWQKYEKFRVNDNSYKYHVFPSGFSAHWVRLVPDKDCTATAEFFYS